MTMNTDPKDARQTSPIQEGPFELDEPDRPIPIPLMALALALAIWGSVTLAQDYSASHVLHDPFHENERP
ncbi:MAG: hypothetical protein ROR55_22240 [Devosia sp.]